MSIGRQLSAEWSITYNCAMKSSVVVYVYVCEKLSRKLKKMVRHLQFVYFVVRVMVKPIVAEPVLYRYWTTLVYLRLLW